MKKEEMFKIVRKLVFDKETTIYTEKNMQICLFRPSKLSKRFKGYDVKKNFQIWLREGERTFRPNHLRVMMDLNLRIRSRPKLKEKLLLAFDNIYYGNDPETELKSLANEEFEHFLNSLIVTGTLAQLFHIEQEFGYNKESKFDPPNLFLQGWIREFIDSPKEIDKVVSHLWGKFEVVKS